MNALGHILRRVALFIVELTDEAPAPPQLAPRPQPEPLACRLGPDETAELLARYAGQHSDDADPDALEALREQGRVAHRIGS